MFLSERLEISTLNSSKDTTLKENAIDIMKTTIASFSAMEDLLVNYLMELLLMISVFSDCWDCSSSMSDSNLLFPLKTPPPRIIDCNCGKSM